MPLNFGSEILALFLCVMWTVVVLLIGSFWHPKRQLVRDVTLAVGEFIGVLLIARWCEAPVTAIVVFFVLLIGYDHYFDAWKIHHPPSPLH